MSESIESLSALVKEIDSILGSRAWAKMCESLDASAMKAVYEMGGSSAMSKDEVDFRRGAIWAFGVLKSLPMSIRMQTTSAIAMKGMTKRGSNES